MQDRRLLEISIALSQEKDEGKLFSMILEAAMSITNCDGGTLYVLKEEALHFRILRTISQNVFQDAAKTPITLPPVALTRQNVCSYTALEKSLVNIADVYEESPYFDFSGPRKYDSITGFRTQSMLVVPMEDDYGDIVGVLQLINAQDADGKTIPFEPKFEETIWAFASQAAMRLTNMNYQAEVVSLLDSFVRVISTSIDARSPYNANHTRNMVIYAERFLRRTEEKVPYWKKTPSETREFLMSIWLHDIGKLVIPLEVMDKQNRLGTAVDTVAQRMDMMELLAENRLLKGEISPEEHESYMEETRNMRECVMSADTAGFLPQETIDVIQSWGRQTYTNASGKPCPNLTEEELVALSVQRGTLTAAERVIMESHVTMTDRMLWEMNFSRDCLRAREWAGMHHEFINGTGYPRKRKGAEIPAEVRLLTILDIFDALTAQDRPYKPPMPPEKALSILHSMAEKEGKLDGDILALFEECQPWEESLEGA